ncbi:MAG TPA: hypothetical protein VKV73_09965 [Chloroflexota bacterium]|nr:hypothetical protein [Chloroflexota bacterium]
MLDTLVAYLTARELLLVIDNCEHLIDACADLAEQVLSRCPRLRLLATSREQLRIGGAVTWRVPSLASPDPRATLSPADVLLYGRQRLVTRAEPAEVRRRQASFFLAFGEQRERASNVGGPEPRAATAALDQEYPNLRLALGWSLELGEAQIGLRIVRAVQYFWQARAHHGEGLTWLEVATAGVRERPRSPYRCERMPSPRDLFGRQALSQIPLRASPRGRLFLPRQPQHLSG